jgi:hypothetical protein
MAGEADLIPFCLNGEVNQPTIKSALLHQGDPPPLSAHSRQLHLIEKWFPGERLTAGLVKMSIL